MSGKSRSLWPKILVAISVILFVFFLLLSVICVYLVIVGRKVSAREFQSNTYQIQQIDLQTNETAVGFVRIPEKLKVDGFFSYNTIHNNIVLISNYGSRDYHCTGSCICVSERRLVISRVVSNGLVALLVAVSLSVAVKVAQERFKENCIAEFSDECSEGTITSTVDECHEQASGEEVVGESESYLCKGNCVDNDEIYDLPMISMDKASGFPNCEGIDLSTTVKYPAGEEMEVENFFLENHLKPLCDERSQITVEKRCIECIVKVSRVKLPFCTGGSLQKGHVEHNPSIFCKKIL